MSKFLSIAAAAGLALALTAAPSLAAQQHHDNGPSQNDVGVGIAAGTLGFLAGAAAASNGDEVGFHHHRHMSDYEQHVQDCEDAYGWRYNPNTDLVKVHHHFEQCDL